jgi:hypothetical protein
MNMVDGYLDLDGLDIGMDLDGYLVLNGLGWTRHWEDMGMVGLGWAWWMGTRNWSWLDLDSVLTWCWMDMVDAWSRWDGLVGHTLPGRDHAVRVLGVLLQLD